MKLSIVIVSYNTARYLRPCLDSLVPALEGVDAEVIVADNGSTDGSPEWLATHPRVDLFVPMGRNAGFAAANNAAVEHARGEWVFFLNPDTLADSGSFRDLVRFMSAAPPHVVAVGPTVTNADGSFQRQCVRSLPEPRAAARHLFPRLSRLLGLRPAKPYLPYEAAPTSPLRAECLSGAAMGVRRETFVKMGGFDMDYFLFAEDTDLCKRIGDSGLECWHTPTAPILHYGGGATQTRSKRSTKEFYGAAEIYYRKHHMRGTRFPGPGHVVVLLGIRVRCWLDLAMLATGRRKHVGSLKPRARAGTSR